VAKKLECNYDRNIFAQLEETIELNEKLQKEIKELKAAHRSEIYKLTAKAGRNEKENIEASYRKAAKEKKAVYEKEIYLINAYYERGMMELKKELTAEIRVLKEIVWRQATEIEQLKEENAGLREILNKDSGNSSKPPSSDGFKKIHNSRVSTGKKAGGQAGHKGHKPEFFENPTEIIEIKANKCKCGGRFIYTANAYGRKQLVDIEIKTNVTEYREYAGKCECCGSKSSNRAPVSDRITYGSNLKSFCNMLSVEGNVSVNRTSQMMAELSGGLVKLSDGTLCKWNRDLSKLLAPSIQKIKEKLLVSPVLHKDETGIWVDKELRWLHVLSDDKYTLYYADAKRGKDADIEASVLPAFKGVLVHDNWKSLYHFACTHAECNAHVLRYLKGAVESKERQWAQDMIDFLLKAKAAVEEKALNVAEIQDFYRLYDEILENGRLEYLHKEKQNYNGDDIRLLRRLKEYKEQHLLFLSDRNVPFDNNQAERDLRMIKAKTKISGCFRSDDGGSVFAALKTYTASLRKNGRNIFIGLVGAWSMNPVLF